MYAAESKLEDERWDRYLDQQTAEIIGTRPTAGEKPMSVNENLARVRALMSQEVLSEAEVQEVVEKASISGAIPGADGYRDGQPFWRKGTIARWASTATRIRSRTAAPPTHYREVAISTRSGRSRQKGSMSFDPSSRSFTAIVATETPSQVYDFDTGDVVLEVLVAEGGEFPESLPMCVDHEHTARSTCGRMHSPYLEGRQWSMIGQIGMSGELEDEMAGKVEDGTIDSMSIGYRPRKFQRIAPGQSAVIDGREFENPYDQYLQVTTEWAVHEVSLVSIPADPQAKIRSQQFIRGGTMSRAPAAHSRQSITGQASVGQLTSALMLRAGINDPTRHRAAFDNLGNLVRVAPSLHTERDADLAQSMVDLPAREIMRRAAALDGHDLCANYGNVGQFLWTRRASIVNLSDLYRNTMGSFVLSGWDSAGDSTDDWIEEVDQINYLPQPAARISGMQLTHHAKGGVADGVNIEAVAENMTLSRFSAEFTIDEIDVVNAFSMGSDLFDTVIPKQMGAAARAMKPNLAYAVLLANPNMADGLPLFDVTHGNLFGSAAIADATISAAAAAMGKQRERGVDLNLRASHLITPLAIERDGRKLVAEIDLLNEASTPAPIVRSDSRLDNGVVHPLTKAELAGSASTWFMASSTPGHGLQASFLKGTGRMPTIHMSMLEQGEFGYSFTVKHSIGITPIGWRGLAKNQVASLG